MEIDSSSKSTANAIRCRSVKVMISIWLPIHLWSKGDGLFLKHGNGISDGASLLMGKNSPFWDGYCNY